jgi:hypothetical protein
MNIKKPQKIEGIFNVLRFFQALALVENQFALSVVASRF